MQLLELIIWPRQAELEPRRLKFALGKVNVILGPFATGKSSIWSILDFCLGSSTLRVPIGITRDTSAWFGALFQAPDHQILLARPNPDTDGTRDALILEGPEVFAPERPATNSTLKELKAFLNRRLTRFRSSNWGRVSCRDVVAINVRPQHLLSNPTAVLFDERNESSLNKIRAALPSLTREGEPAELSSLRSNKRTVETLGLYARKASDQLVQKTFDLYAQAQRLQLCPQSSMGRQFWQIGDVMFELQHVLRRNAAFVSMVEEQLNEAPSRPGAVVTNVVTEEVSSLPMNGNLSVEGSDTVGSPRALARIFTLGAIRELLEPTDLLLSDLTKLRYQWRALNGRLNQLLTPAAGNYVGLTRAIQRYAQTMQLDYSQVPIVLEERTLQLKFELGGRKTLYLADMGGNRNYAGYGIALLLALHEAIDRQGGLGVGRFLFIDAMSQAFASKSPDSDDRDQAPIALALSTLFDACVTMAGRFQVILLERELDRALLDECAGPVHVVEDWSDSRAGLIPHSWGTHEA